MALFVSILNKWQNSLRVGTLMLLFVAASNAPIK